MRLNVKKTETMGVSDGKSPITVKVGPDTVREVHSFKYLGARFNAEATCVEAVKRGWVSQERMDSLNTLWTSKNINSCRS